ncbi:hypothetical protein SASPL_110007 [Salvia splendens]|uniref:U6 snRNA-associated Sm-like protein LSm1 n=1 Tax=Salvia splendens TaxID=180675 RepID=A0A8X9A2D2_SALSN|nr:hypothetical protein SASPL_110007 [Salvia splendens]
MSWAGPEDVFLSTSLASYLDKKLLVLLRDGRKLLGILRSFDQFANAVLEGAWERVIVGGLYCDIPLGLYIIRGENVVLIGELDLDKEELPSHMTRVSSEEIKRVSSNYLCAEGRKRSFGAQGYDEQEDGLPRYGLILMDQLRQSSSSLCSNAEAALLQILSRMLASWKYKQAG